MKFLERDLEDIIWDNIQERSNQRKLYSRGLIPANYIHRSFRQLRIGNYGIADIVTAYRDTGGGLYVTVWELKRSGVDINSLIQVSKYVKGIQSYLKKRISNELYVVVDCVLIGNYVDSNSDWVFLNSMLNNVRVFTYDYDIDGIKFHEDLMNYTLTEEGFHV